MHRLLSSKHRSSEGPKPLTEGKRPQLSLSCTRRVIVTLKQTITVLEEKTATAEDRITGKGSKTLDLREGQGGITLTRRANITQISTLSTSGMHMQVIYPLASII